MKQTAVEWLVEQLFSNNEIFGVSKELFEQAKAMEKIQMEDFFCMGILDSGEDGLGFNHYYNETFKNK